MKNRAAAFTLMEVTVVMLISAICISICYTAYGLISGRYVDFATKNKLMDDTLWLKQMMEKDVLKAKCLIKVENGFLVECDTYTVTYLFNEKQVFRKYQDLDLDSFDIQVQKINFHFEGQKAEISDTVDRVNLILLMKSNLSVPLELNKNYSSADLYR